MLNPVKWDNIIHSNISLSNSALTFKIIMCLIRYMLRMPVGELPILKH